MLFLVGTFYINYSKQHPIMNKNNDIRESARATLQQAFTDIKSRYRSTKFILVLDDSIVQIISSIFDMSELMKNNIVLVERYSLKRRPLQHYHAIYLFGPDVDIQNFIDDWTEPMYSAPHVLFTFAANENILNTLQSNPHVVDHILTFKFLYIHFRPLDPLTFCVDCPNTLNSMYSPSPKDSLGKTDSFIVQGLLSFFFTIRTKPHVAYSKNSPPCESLAHQFTGTLEHTIETLPQDIASSFTQNNTLLVIIPRGDDPVAPLLHQFTFEAMVYEYYDVVNSIYTINPKDSHAFLSLDYYYDETYKEIRYVHYERLIDTVRARAQPFLDLQAKQREGNVTEKKEANRKIAQNRKQYDQCISEFQVSLEIVDRKVTRAVMDSSEYEQNMASGWKDRDTKFKPSKVELSQMLSRNDLSETDKMRILAIYSMVGNSLSPSDIQRTLQSAGISESNRDTALNASLVNDKVERKNKYDKEQYTTSKYIPYISEVTSNAIDNKLPSKYFDLPSPLGKYSNIVIFVMGGVSCMELREVNEIRTKIRAVKVYVGSTGLLTPQEYLKQIGELRTNPQ